MLYVRPAPPVDYALCNQTVTLYHVEAAGEYRRTVIHGTHLDFRKNASVDKLGSKASNSFLLVLPQGADGQTYYLPQEYAALEDKTGAYTLAPGDKVLLGEGAEISTREEWAQLIPSMISGCGVVQAIDPKYWRGELCHVEAGG